MTPYLCPDDAEQADRLVTPSKMVTMGLLGYSADQISDMLDVSQDHYEQFKADFDNPESIIAKAYKKGQSKRLFQFEKNLMTLANGDPKAGIKGDLKAQMELEGRILARERLARKD